MPRRMDVCPRCGWHPCGGPRCAINDHVWADRWIWLDRAKKEILRNMKARKEMRRLMERFFVGNLAAGAEED